MLFHSHPLAAEPTPNTIARLCAHLGLQVRRNFAVDDTGIFAQLGLLAGLLEALDPPVFYKLRQVGAPHSCH